MDRSSLNRFSPNFTYVSDDKYSWPFLSLQDVESSSTGGGGGGEGNTDPITKLPYDRTRYVLLKGSVFQRKYLSQEKFMIE